jgi:peptide/nickel transport system ATP-binding protein
VTGSAQPTLAGVDDHFPIGDPSAPVVEADDLVTWLRTPRGPARAVDGISLRIAAGQTLGVVGESGSGKTMLSRSVMGLLPRRIVERLDGTVRYRGVEVPRHDETALRRLWGREMAMVFQNPLTSLNPVVPIGRQISESLAHHYDMGRDERREHALELLRSVGLPEAEHRLGSFPHELSGGMRQRVVIAIALACGPGLLIADEPTTALDVTVQRQILDLLDQQRRERSMAMMLITHDLAVVAGRADEVAVVYAGQVVERAPAAELFASPRHPYTRALLDSIPSPVQPSHARLDAIAGRPPDLVAPPDGCRFAPRCAYVTDACRVAMPELVEAQGSVAGVGGRPTREVRCIHPVASSEGLS